MSTSDNVYRYVTSNFRKHMRRLGFVECSVCKAPDLDDMVIVTAYDPVDCKHFCRSYTLDDLQCILHANNIFWRYLK